MAIRSDELKARAANAAVEFVESGMVVGLGHGSTALFAIQRLAEKLRSGTLSNIKGIPCSKAVEKAARELGIELTTLEHHPQVDITIDGADEVAPSMDVIKGGGGALLQEKIVAQASRREVIIVDQSKLSPVLGTKWAVPIEVVPFGWKTELLFLERLGASVSVRCTAEGRWFSTDQGNMILDANFGPIEDVSGLARALDRRAAIVEHGLFIDLATDILIAEGNHVKHLRRS